MQTSERWIVGSLITVALLTFFFPLVTIQVPVLGDQDISGYDFVAKAKESGQSLDPLKSRELGEPPAETSDPPGDAPNRRMSASAISFPVQTLPFVSIEIIVSFACALFALFSCLGSFTGATTVISTFGLVAATTSLLHLTMANSDLHTWFREQMKAESSVVANNPFAGLAQQIGNLAANSFQLKAGTGLYVLVASLLLATILLHSRILVGFSGADSAIEVDPPQSDGTGRIFGFPRFDGDAYQSRYHCDYSQDPRRASGLGHSRRILSGQGPNLLVRQL